MAPASVAGGVLHLSGALAIWVTVGRLPLHCTRGRGVLPAVYVYDMVALRVLGTFIPIGRKLTEWKFSIRMAL
jgi:hypothetical protein